MGVVSAQCTVTGEEALDKEELRRQDATIQEDLLRDSSCVLFTWPLMTSRRSAHSTYLGVKVGGGIPDSSFSLEIGG